jgi:TetR/AcrR family transcriptional repressor of mexJK operon
MPNQKSAVKKEKTNTGSRARKRYDILLAGKKVFLEKGYGATSMDEIAMQASVSKKTVYDKFKNKQTLFAAVIQELCERINPPEFLVTDAHKDIKTVLTKFGEWFLSRIYSTEQVNLLQTVINDSRQFSEVGEMMFQGPIMRMQNAVAGYLAVQIQNGRLTLKDPQKSAAILISMMKSDIHMALLLGQSQTNLQSLIRLDVAVAVSLFLKGAQAGRTKGHNGASNELANPPKVSVERVHPRRARDRF